MKLAFNMEIVKITKLTKIYVGNRTAWKPSQEKGSQLSYIYTIRYIDVFYYKSRLM